jgi:hypothetical protein
MGYEIGTLARAIARPIDTPVLKIQSMYAQK